MSQPVLPQQPYRWIAGYIMRHMWNTSWSISRIWRGLFSVSSSLHRCSPKVSYTVAKLRPSSTPLTSHNKVPWATSSNSHSNSSSSSSNNNNNNNNNTIPRLKQAAYQTSGTCSRGSHASWGRRGLRLHGALSQEWGVRGEGWRNAGKTKTKQTKWVEKTCWTLLRRG